MAETTTTPTGGAPATGTGALPATGGTPATGGLPATGGSSAPGGSPATEGSPPAVRLASQSEIDIDQARQRLAALQTALTTRFDRRSWDEYLQLRRAKQAALI